MMTSLLMKMTTSLKKTSNLINTLKQDIRNEISTKFELNSNTEMFLYFLSETFYYLKLMFLNFYNNLKKYIKSKG